MLCAEFDPQAPSKKVSHIERPNPKLPKLETLSPKTPNIGPTLNPKPVNPKLSQGQPLVPGSGTVLLASPSRAESFRAQKQGLGPRGCRDLGVPGFRGLGV